MTKPISLPADIQESAGVYIANIRKMLHGIYRIMKDYQIVPAEPQAYLKGYMMAARTLKIISSHDLNQIVDEESRRVFGMSAAERKKKSGIKRVSVLNKDFLAIPAIQRRDLSLW